MATDDLRTRAVDAKSTDGYSLQLVAIRSHNDELRSRFRGGKVSVSDEVRELGHIVVAHALLTMAEASEFDHAEHSGGRFAFLRPTARGAPRSAAANERVQTPECACATFSEVGRRVRELGDPLSQHDHAFSLHKFEIRRRLE